jgi:sugar phosphate isomerase/epimerase
MDIQQLFKPGLLIVQLFPKARIKTGETSAAIQLAVDRQFYHAVEHGEVNCQRERKSIAQVVTEHRLVSTYWLSMAQYESRTSISATDEDERTAAVKGLMAHIPFAAECGAQYVGILSGRDVGADRRVEAKQQLMRSARELWGECERYGVPGIVIENSDREAHKKHLLGPTAETVELIDQVNRDGGCLSLCFDTAHIRLLDEPWADAFRLAQKVVTHVHLANCVSDRRQEQFGDHHMPFGTPGFLTFDFLTDFFRESAAMQCTVEARPCLSAEVAGTAAAPGNVVELQTRRMITEAWSAAQMAGAH